MGNKRVVNRRPYPSAKEVAKAESVLADAQNIPSSLKLSFTDTDFLLSEDMRHVRLMLEMLKPETILKEHGIEQTIVVFGSARIASNKVAEKNLKEAESALNKDPDNTEKQQKVESCLNLLRKTHYYDEARKLGQLIGEHFKKHDSDSRFYLATGGGPGIMEAANHGASDAGVKNIGFTIALPKEFPNIYSTPELTFQFHYFAVRKMHLLMRARALIVFPGGYGTLDELFETLTLIQTYRMESIPILLFGEEFWQRIIDFDALLDEGVISAADLDRFEYVSSAEQAWSKIVQAYDL